MAAFAMLGIVGLGMALVLIGFFLGRSYDDWNK